MKDCHLSTQLNKLEVTEDGCGLSEAEFMLRELLKYNIGYYSVSQLQAFCYTPNFLKYFVKILRVFASIKQIL